MPCEDAPCCGCCGPNVWYQEDLAADEARFESLDDDFYDEFESADDPELAVPAEGKKNLRTSVECFWNSMDYTTNVEYTYIETEPGTPLVEHNDYTTFHTSSWREGVNKADLWLREALS